jgi:hypothetical protein
MAWARRAVLLAFVSLLLVVATACGADSESAGPQQTSSSGTAGVADQDIAMSRMLAEVSTRTRATTSRVRMVSTITQSGQRYVVTMHGTFDFRAETGSLVISFPGGAISRTEERFTAGNLFFRLPADPTQPKRLIWVRVPRAEAKVRYLLRPPGNDPGYVLEQLPKARSVRLSGSEQLGGVPTKHYRGLLDLQTATADFDSSQREQVLQLQNAWPDQGAPVDVWVDESGTVRRVVESLDLGGIAIRLQLDLTMPGDATQAHPRDPAESVEGKLQGILMG